MLSRHIYCIFNRFGTESVMKAGRVLTWGTGGFGHGRLPADPIDQKLNVPGEIKDIGERVIKVSTGLHHTLLLTQSSSVYGMGLNSCGQIGDVPEIVEEPAKIEWFNKNNVQVRKIRAGDYHNLALDTTGNIFAWGSNSKRRGLFYNSIFTTGNRLGLGMKHLSTKIPMPVKGLQDVKDIMTGDSFSLALTKEGRVFGWGNCFSGRLLDIVDPLFEPRELTSLTHFLNKKHTHIKKIKTSGSYTVFLTDNGKLYTFGRSYFGATGTRPNPLINENEVHAEVTPVIDEAFKGQKVVDFKLSPFALIFTTDKGNVYYTGLSLAYKPRAFPKKIENVKTTFATLNSVGVITQDNQVYYINDKLVEDSDQDPNSKVFVVEDEHFKGDVRAIGGKYDLNYAIVA